MEPKWCQNLHWYRNESECRFNRNYFGMGFRSHVGVDFQCLLGQWFVFDKIILATFMVKWLSKFRSRPGRRVLDRFGLEWVPKCKEMKRNGRDLKEMNDNERTWKEKKKKEAKYNERKWKEMQGLNGIDWKWNKTNGMEGNGRKCK